MTEKQNLPPAYQRVLSGELILAEKRRGSELMALRDIIPFSSLIEQAWQQLCITFDEPLLESATNLNDLKDHSFKVYERKRRELQNYGRDVVETQWTQGQNYIKEFKSYDKDSRSAKHTLIFMGAALLVYPRLNFKVVDKFKSHRVHRFIALANRLEKKFQRPLNDPDTIGPLTSYFVSLDNLTEARGQALKPITGKINHLQTPGLVRQTSAEYFEKEIERLIKLSEPHRYYAGRLSKHLHQTETGLFQENAPITGDLWRTVFFIRDTKLIDIWPLMENLLDGETDTVITQVQNLAMNDPKKLPLFIVNKIIEGTWPETRETEGLEYL